MLLNFKKRKCSLFIFIKTDLSRFRLISTKNIIRGREESIRVFRRSKTCFAYRSDEEEMSVYHFLSIYIIVYIYMYINLEFVYGSSSSFLSSHSVPPTQYARFRRSDTAGGIELEVLATTVSTSCNTACW